MAGRGAGSSPVPGYRRVGARLWAPVALVLVVATGLLGVSGGLSSAAAGGGDPSATVTVDGGHRSGPALNQGLIGVNHPVPASGPALRAIGTRWARLDVSFQASVGGTAVYNCATGAWNPAYLDPKVAAARSTGATPELIVDYTPPCLAAPKAGANPVYRPPDVGSNAVKWEALVRQMALHEILAHDVRVFEVWNEPNGFFWSGTLHQYLTLYQNTADALEQAAAEAHRRIEVGGPALADFSATPDMAWVRAMAAFVSAHHLPLDFFSWHEYANDPDVGPSASFPQGLCFLHSRGPAGRCDNPSLSARSVGRGVRRVRAALARYPSLHPKLWLDEWNVNAGYDPRMSGTYGGAFVAAVLDSAQGAGLNRSCFYEAVDDAALDNFGLLTASLAPKPAYRVFAMWHRMAGHIVPVSVARGPSNAAPSSVGAVASRGPGDSLRVLIDNFAPTGPVGHPGQRIPAGLDQRVAVDLHGLSAGRYVVTRSLVDTTHQGSIVARRSVRGPGANIRFELQGQGVTLVSVVPFRPHRPT